jgi:hypothetical protein
MLKRDIIPFLQALIDREITNRAVAKLLGVSEEHLCRTLTMMRVVKIPAEKRRDPIIIKARREHIAHLAVTLPVKLAAEAGRCSVSTISRYKRAAKASENAAKTNK